MISKIEVVDNLNRLNGLFNSAINNPVTYPEANFYAKLAILEASAWLEQCVEDLYEKIAQPNLSVNINIKSFESTIKRNHGFNYDDYFRNKLLLNLIGLINLEKMESNIASTQKFQDMKGALNSLTLLRGNLAHNHLTGVTTLSVQTVGQTITLFNQAILGLVEIEKYLKKIKFK